MTNPKALNLDVQLFDDIGVILGGLLQELAKILRIEIHDRLIAPSRNPRFLDGHKLAVTKLWDTGSSARGWERGFLPL